MSCEDGTCSVDQGCGSSCGCNKGGCSTGCEMTDMIMLLGNKAWEQLMIEKMKAHYEKRIGEKMDKTAEAGVEAVMAYWQHKMQGKAACAEHSQKVQESFKG